MTPLDWQIVRSAPLFGAMPSDIVKAMIRSTGPRVCGKGTVLFQQGDQAKDFFVVLEGWVKVAARRSRCEGSVNQDENAPGLD